MTINDMTSRSDSDKISAFRRQCRVRRVADKEPI